MIKAVVFDFYGVICADSFYSWVDKHYLPNDPLRPYFAEVCEQSDTGKLTEAQFFQEISQLSGLTPAELRGELGGELIIHQDVVRIIDRLKHRKIKIGVLSNSPTTLHKIIAGSGLVGYFDQILTSAETKYIKPEPAFFKLMLGRLQVEPAEAVFVDDHAKNVLGAEATGMTGVIYTNAKSLERQLAELL